MMKRCLFLGCALTAALFASSPTYAASDDECANWLCLPAGYPGGANCGDAKDAARERMRRGDGPLPPYDQCSAEDPETLPPEWGLRAITGNATRYGGEYHHYETCRWNKDGLWEPYGCNGRNYTFVQVFNGLGEQQGEIYYFLH